MAWTPDDQRDFTRFSQRLQPQLAALKQQGISCYEQTSVAEMKALQTSR